MEACPGGEDIPMHDTADGDWLAIRQLGDDFDDTEFDVFGHGGGFDQVEPHVMPMDAASEHNGCLAGEGHRDRGADGDAVLRGRKRGACEIEDAQSHVF